jgi:excisionase family DNA binding protein
MESEQKSAERPLARGIKQAAELVGVSPSYIRKAIASGELRRTRLGRRVLIKDSDLVEWLNRSDEPKAA